MRERIFTLWTRSHSNRPVCVSEYLAEALLVLTENTEFRLVAELIVQLLVPACTRRSGSLGSFVRQGHRGIAPFSATRERIAESAGVRPPAPRVPGQATVDHAP